MLGKRQLIVQLIILFSFLFPQSYTSTPSLQLDIIDYSNLQKQGYPTDSQLISLAVEKGLLPDNPKDLDIQTHKKEQNTLIFWLTSRREGKIKSIDTSKSLFKEKAGITIKNPSAYYVDQINGVIYKALKNGDIEGYNKKGIGTVFKTIAIQEGDFDTNDGRNAMEIMRDYWGEEEFEWYKKTYPKKFEALIKINNNKER